MENSIGKKYSRWTILECFEKLDRGLIKMYCKCQCECGHSKIMTLNSVINEYSKSCGCLQSDVKLDEFSPFRYTLSSIKQRKDRPNGKKARIYCNLDLIYLKELWENQKGKCPYSSIEMTLPRNNSIHRNRRTISCPHMASLDRINPDLGYVKGNVEFVCLAINYAKNDFTKLELIEFINKIKNG